MPFEAQRSIRPNQHVQAKVIAPVRPTVCGLHEVNVGGLMRPEQSIQERDTPRVVLLESRTGRRCMDARGGWGRGQLLVRCAPRSIYDIAFRGCRDKR